MVTGIGNTGEHTEKLRTSDAETNDTLVNTVEERLANLNAITKGKVDHSEADEEDDLDESTPEGKGGEKDGQADDEDDPDESTPGGDGDGKEGQEDKELPPAFLRAAIHRGWKEEDAQQFFKDNPDAAVRTFQNCYMDVNNASREWAKIGKARAGQSTQQIEATGSKPKPAALDLDKLIKDYDLDDATVEQLRAQQKEIETYSEEQTSVTQNANSGVDPNVVLEIENFFNAEMLKGYDKFYGSIGLGQDWSDLSSGQRGNRMRVLQEADMIMLGAEAASVKMDSIDVLERAHMIVTEPIREQVIRDGLKKTATKRKKSMMLRPSDGTRSSSKTGGSDAGSNKQGSRDREQLNEAVQDKLNHLFNS